MVYIITRQRTVLNPGPLQNSQQDITVPYVETVTGLQYTSLVMIKQSYFDNLYSNMCHNFAMNSVLNVKWYKL